MTTWEKVVAWCKRWWGVLVAGVLLVLGAVGLYTRQRAQLGAALDEAAVADARRQMDALRAARVEVTSRADAKTEEIQALDAQIAESKRRIVDLHEHGTDVPDEQLDDAFASLGY